MTCSRGGEALAFLAGRTGLDDAAGARELAAELGFLPLGLAQAAALIAREHLSYATYLERLLGTGHPLTNITARNLATLTGKRTNRKRWYKRR